MKFQVSDLILQKNIYFLCEIWVQDAYLELKKHTSIF